MMMRRECEYNYELSVYVIFKLVPASPANLSQRSRYQINEILFDCSRFINFIIIIVSLTTRDELNFQFVFTRSLLVDTVVATTASAAVLRVNGEPSPFVIEKPIFVVSLPQSHDLQIHRRHISSRMKTTEIDTKVTYRVRFVVWINILWFLVCHFCWIERVIRNKINA